MSIISDEIDERYPLQPESTVTMARSQATMLSRSAYDAAARRKPSGRELHAARSAATTQFRHAGQTVWTVGDGTHRGHRHVAVSAGRTICLDQLVSSVLHAAQAAALEDD